MKNDSRFLVAEKNQTHLSYTEYTFNGGQIIISKTGNKSIIKNLQNEIKRVISLSDIWGIVYTDFFAVYLVIFSIENQQISLTRDHFECVVDDSQFYYYLIINDKSELTWWSNNSTTNKSKDIRLYSSIDFKSASIYTFSDIGFLVEVNVINENNEIGKTRYLVINAYDPIKAFRELVIDWSDWFSNHVIYKDAVTLLQGFILPNNTIVRILKKDKLLIFLSTDFSLMIPKSMCYIYIYILFILIL